MKEMTEHELAEEQENEVNNGCCECGEVGHGCNDCPVFMEGGQPKIELGTTYVNVGTVYTVKVPVTVTSVFRDGYGYWHVMAVDAEGKGPFGTEHPRFGFEADRFVKEFQPAPSDPSEEVSSATGPALIADLDEEEPGHPAEKDAEATVGMKWWDAVPISSTLIMKDVWEGKAVFATGRQILTVDLWTDEVTGVKPL